MSAEIAIRPATAADLGFLEEMLFEAFFWDPAAARPAFDEFRDDPEFRKLLSAWGRRGDCAVIAGDAEAPLGAAWYRLWTPQIHSYGFVDERTPELAIGVGPAQRSRGIGRALLHALVRAARDDGFTALSLSVSPQNFARKLYESEGFHKVGESGTSWTLLKTLAPK